MVAKGGRLPSRSVAVLGQPWSIRPKLTGVAPRLSMEDRLGEDDLDILTDSLSATLKSMPRKDSPFKLELYRHPARVRQLLLLSPARGTSKIQVA
jgi:hypothetical protein